MSSNISTELRREMARVQDIINRLKRIQPKYRSHDFADNIVALGAMLYRAETARSMEQQRKALIELSKVKLLNDGGVLLLVWVYSRLI